MELAAPQESLTFGFYRNSENPLIKRAQRFIALNFDRDLTLDELSQHLGCSKFYLVKIFRIYLNTTPIRFLWKYRIEKAIKTLNEAKSIPLIQLAMDHGFKNPSHFSTQFKKHTGACPRDYLAQVMSRAQASELLAWDESQNLLEAALTGTLQIDRLNS